ncbi:error-prone DNA polymerase [Hydrobacter penzbergensis]|uniref:Error-prone DNA polymerase n=2 Tax=Hydrobacter penzbergensis TaxID=1235997 RepID=A0A8X8IEI9_9BACT|nr:error-prone DNA polymerase [Hydrobacter penzbergensis]
MERGYTADYAARVFKQLEGFGSYGFPESHASSFALLVYISSWLKCFYPDVFACALLNSWPMGFYQPAQIIIDARKHGVEVRPIDINHSDWDNTLEEKAGKYCALRLGFRQIKGIREEDMQLVINNRHQPYTSINALRDTGLSDKVLIKLADADAFRSIGLDRRQALWEVSTKDNPIELYKGHPAPAAANEKQIELPFMQLSEHVVEDYATTGLSLKAHPVRFLRPQLDQLHVTTTADLSRLRNGDRVKVAGLVLVRQHPGTAKGVLFMTIEDETGNANAVIWESVSQQYRNEILSSRLILLEGKLQIEGLVIHIVVEKCHNLSRLLKRLTPSHNYGLSVSSHPDTTPQNIFFGGRNFK